MKDMVCFQVHIAVMVKHNCVFSFHSICFTVCAAGCVYFGIRSLT